MTGTEQLENAIASTRAVLANVSRSQLGDPTPCASWDVAALINHVVGVQYFMQATMLGTEPTGQDQDYAAGDYLAAFDQASGSCVEVFGAPGALDGTVNLGGNEIPAAAFMGIAMNDTFVHGWDLAKATGQSTDLDAGLAAGILEQSKMLISDAFRGDEGAPFGAQRPAPEGAGPADQLAAFCGRSV